MIKRIDPGQQQKPLMIGDDWWNGWMKFSISSFIFMYGGNSLKVEVMGCSTAV